MGDFADDYNGNSPYGQDFFEDDKELNIPFNKLNHRGYIYCPVCGAKQVNKRCSNPICPV